MPQDAPYAAIVSPPPVAGRWSGKRTAAIGAIALALAGAGAVAAAAATPTGMAGPMDHDGRGGPGSFQNRQLGPGSPGAPGAGQGAGPNQQGQQGQQAPGQGTGPQQRGNH